MATPRVSNSFTDQEVLAAVKVFEQVDKAPALRSYVTAPAALAFRKKLLGMRDRIARLRLVGDT